MLKLDEEYWTERYQNEEIGWDIGYPSTPIKQYMDYLSDKSIKILIPGAGNSYEAEYIYNQGFKNLYVCDLSVLPLQNLKNRIPTIPEDHLIHGNFFELEGSYDLIIEQTFFCALDPSLREDYAKKMIQLLSNTGRLVGVMFGINFEKTGPPFGGNIREYQELFSEHFDIHTMETCYNSIPPRADAELFINMTSKS